MKTTIYPQESFSNVRSMLLLAEKNADFLLEDISEDEDYSEAWWLIAKASSVGITDSEVAWVIRTADKLYKKYTI